MSKVLNLNSYDSSLPSQKNEQLLIEFEKIKAKMIKKRETKIRDKLEDSINYSDFD